MRQILFRGKRVDSDEWAEGYLFKIWNRTFLLWGTTNGVPNMIEVKSETVGQYTGLTDKNGKKIFEGDIVTPALPDDDFCYEEVCIGDFEVDGHYDCYGVFSKSKIEDVYDNCPICGNYRLVAGNIFDNADLLNKVCTWEDWDLLRNKKGGLQ